MADTIILGLIGAWPLLAELIAAAWVPGGPKRPDKGVAQGCGVMLHVSY